MISVKLKAFQMIIQERERGKIFREDIFPRISVLEKSSEIQEKFGESIK